MTGLSSELYKQCRETLLKCNEFDSDASLRAVFVTQELTPFKTGLPEADSRNGRVDVTLAYLLSKRLVDGRSALSLFLKALYDRYQPGDALRGELEVLIAAVQSALTTVFDQRGQTVFQGNGEAPAPESPLGTGSRWAVLVGVNEYQDETNYGRLHVCVKDVEAAHDALVAGGFDPARVRLLTDHTPDPPTKANVLVALKAVADATEPDDLLLFYYSGHGDEAGGESYLVARDGRRLVLADTAVPVPRVKQILEAAPARAKVILLDACHSGADVGGKGPRPMSAEFIRRVFEEAEGLAILASCKQGQLSYEWQAQERSVFTHYLLEALAGEADRDEKGFVTVQDASRHVTNGVKLWASQRNASQTPTLEYRVAGDIILTNYHDTPLPAEGSRDNPFGDTGRIADPGRFFDREEVLRQIFEELGKGVNLSLVGESQVGKSSLLTMVCALGPERLNLPREAFAYVNLEWVDGEDEFYEALCDALGIVTCRGYKLTRALRGARIVLCLDEIEKMTWDGFTVRVRSQLRGLADGPEAPLKLVIASRSPLAHLFPDSPELDSPLAGICRQLDVGPFPPDAARIFLAERLRGTGVTFAEDEIATLLAETGGYPARLQRAAKALFERKKLP